MTNVLKTLYYWAKVWTVNFCILNIRLYLV